MSSTLVDGVTDLFRTQALGPFAARLGESESSVLKGFEATISTLLAGLSSKLSQAGFPRQIMDLLNSPANDTRVLQNARSLVDNPTTDGIGSRFTNMLFGNNLSSVTDSIGNMFGLRGGTASSLMSVGAPLLLSSLIQRVRQTGMDPSRLTKFVSDEASGVRTLLPRGVPNLIDSEAEYVRPVVEEQRSSSGWLLPLLAAAAIVLGLVWWFNSRRSIVEPVRTAATAVTTTAANLITRALPNNVDLHIPLGWMEDRLLTFIQDPSKAVDSTTWFEFDRLLFDTNSDTLQASSQEQLRNIAAILTAYPNVHAKIGGYTDNTGDAASNQALSQRRADTVRSQLIAMGIAADRLEAQGYGEQYPVADNSTEEGRQKNRRIAMRLTAK
jgi:outer membrane protein OmpA-like peptidoglycan-associated protein